MSSQQDDGVKEVSEVVTQSDSPTDENGKDFYADIPEPGEVTDSAPEAEAEEKEEAQESETATKKGAQERIRELNSKAKAEKERADTLAQQIEALTANSQMPDFQAPPPLNEGGEITAEELENRAVQRAVSIFQLQSRQQQVAQAVQREAYEAMKEHPELDPDAGDHYDPELSEAVTESALAYVRANPGKSLKSYINKMMQPYKRAVKREIGDLADTVTRQAAEKALRPTSTPKGEKRPEDMSEKELEERLGIVY